MYTNKLSNSLLNLSSFDLWRFFSACSFIQSIHCMDYSNLMLPLWYAFIFKLTVRWVHCSKYLRDQIFKAIYLEIHWGKSFQIVVLFSWIILLDNAVVAEKKLSKLYLVHNPEGNPPPKSTSVSEPLRSWPSPFQTRSNTKALFIGKSVAGMATDLTLKYSNFAPLKVIGKENYTFWDMCVF